MGRCGACGSVARERTKHSNCSVPLAGPGRAGPAGVLEFVWCKRLEDVTAAAHEMLDILKYEREKQKEFFEEG